MIHELITCDVKPRATAKMEAAFSHAYEQRRQHSELLGSFHTEFGPLNQIVQLWKYADLTSAGACSPH